MIFHFCRPFYGVKCWKKHTFSLTWNCRRSIKNECQNIWILCIKRSSRLMDFRKRTVPSHLALDLALGTLAICCFLYSLKQSARYSKCSASNFPRFLPNGNSVICIDKICHATSLLNAVYLFLSIACGTFIYSEIKRKYLISHRCIWIYAEYGLFASTMLTLNIQRSIWFILNGYSSWTSSLRIKIL